MGVASAIGSAEQPLLSVSGLAVRFGPVQALAGVDLEIAPGEIVALVGENGAGKTTVIRCVAGDIPPTSGEIRLQGLRLPPGSPAAARRGVSVVWQDLALCDNLDVAANVLLGRESRRQARSDIRMHADAAVLLKSLRIPLKDPARFVGDLSGGERQMVAIGRAMVARPRLLLLDEPTASLSVRQAAQVEQLIANLREQGTAVVIASHDVEMLCRLADRVVVLRHGRVIADVDPRAVHPDEIVALLSGQELDSSARRQLRRLHGLTGRLVLADPASSLSLILSALGAALGSDRLCIHLAVGRELVCGASLGLPGALRRAWERLPLGEAGGQPGLAAAATRTMITPDVVAEPAWKRFAPLAEVAGIASSWSVPVLAPGGLAGVITILGDGPGQPARDQLDLVTVYAGYAASAIERDRLLDEVTARNRALETIREVLETLAGPVPLDRGLGVALQSLRHGLRASEVAVLTRPAAGGFQCRGYVRDGAAETGAVPPLDQAPASVLGMAARALADLPLDGAARQLADEAGGRYLAATFTAPAGPSVLLARADEAAPGSEAASLVEDAAYSLRLALEREEARVAQEEATALRRSHELQREFLSRLSHELRTPLTAIRGYASSLMQTDVTWDEASEHRFLDRIATESARLGRLVDDLLDFSSIELGLMRLSPDWSDISLVLEAAMAVVRPADPATITILCSANLPVIWADHDRLQQVFVNLFANALGHNPSGTKVAVAAGLTAPGTVTITVADDGPGMPAEVAVAVFEPRRGRRSKTAGAGLGLSIARGIVAAHGGRLELTTGQAGTTFRVELPVEEGAASRD